MKRIVITAVLALSGAALVAAPATADTVSGATLNWKVSDCIFSACGASTNTQSVTGNVIKGADAWQFTAGTGTYDPATGATSVSYSGAISFGRGGAYAITFVDPQVVVSGTTGYLAADVKVDVTGQPTVTGDDVRIVDLPGVPNATSWTVTPPWDSVGKQFAQPLLDTLPASLKGFFKATGSVSLDPVKPAAPVAMNLGTVTAPMTPKVTIEGVDNQPVNKATTITIKGSGFDPAKRTPAVQGLYVVFGPDPAKVGYALDKAGMFNAASFLPTAPDASGNFTTTLTIEGLYRDSDGKLWDGTKDSLGVATWAAHSRATSAWDTFTPIAFTAATQPRVTLSLQKKTVKAGQRALARVNTDGSGKVRIVKGKRTLVSKRIANGKATLRLPKLKVGKHTLRAVQGDVTSQKVVLRVKRR